MTPQIQYMHINVTAPINSLGYGVVGTNVCMALKYTGHEPALWPIGPVEVEREVWKPQLARMVERRNLYDRLAPSLRIWHQLDLAQHVGKGKHVALPIFELDRFNQTEIHHLDSQDLILVASRWARDVIHRSDIRTPVKVVPFGVDNDIFSSTRVYQNDAGITRFLNIGKWEVRKGHDILVDAFNRAFGPDDPVQLVMVCSNPFLTDEETRQWQDLYRKSTLGHKIDVYERRLPTQKDVADLMGVSDCGVFPSRGEGWNLELGEMMAMGKHVIATDYSAHTEFCTHANSLLIHVDETEPAYDGKWFFGQGDWARLGFVQTERLIDHMRDVHRRKQEGRLGVNTAGVETMKGLTWENTAKRIVQELS